MNILIHIYKSFNCPRNIDAIIIFLVSKMLESKFLSVILLFRVMTTRNSRRILTKSAGRASRGDWVCMVLIEPDAVFTAFAFFVLMHNSTEINLGYVSFQILKL